MKKNKPIRELPNNSLKKSFCIMHITIALLIPGIMQAYTNDTYGENKINFVSDHFTANRDEADIIQQIKVTGKVTDSQTGEPMPGVNIIIKGTTLVITETTLETSRNLTRAPVAQVWDFISTELTAAAAVLPTTQADKGRVTKGATLALKPRVMLFAGRFSDVAATAEEVMDLNVYSLYPAYQTLFTYAAENNIEVIFDKQYIKSSYRNNLFLIMCSNSVYPGSTANIVPTKQCTDIYQMNDGKEITDPTSAFDPYNPYENRDL